MNTIRCSDFVYAPVCAAGVSQIQKDFGHGVRDDEM